MVLFKGRYRIESTRLKGYDYSQAGAYFITIVTQNSHCWFGDVVNGEMVLNDLGRIAQKYWLEIPNHFYNVVLDEFVIMPNHLHGIIIVTADAPDRGNPNVETPNLNNENDVETPNLGNGNVETPNLGNPNVETPNLGVSTVENKKPPTIGLIINQYKRIVTIKIREKYRNFAWQSRFYDHIIRNEQSLNDIREYIIYNPLKWEFDKENPDKIEQ